MKQIVVVFLFLTLSLVNMISAQETETLGIFANLNINGIQFINPVTNELSELHLRGQLSNYSDSLFDIAITPNGKTAAISNFGDSKIFFVRIADGFNSEPTLHGDGYVSLFAEDMEFVPGTNYLLVTDGGFSSAVAVLDYTKGTLVNYVHLNNLDAQAVAVTPDGKIALFADYLGGAIHSYDIGSDGSLTFRETQLVLPNWPLNIAISPDGKTVLIASAFTRLVATFLIDSQYNLCFKGYLKVSALGGQTIIFNKEGNKAYYLSNDQIHGTLVCEFDIEGPGKVSNSGIEIKVEPSRGTGQFFGIETMAMDPTGKYIYVTNPNSTTPVSGISVLDISKKEQVDFLYTKGIPTGIAFTTITK